MLCTTWPLVIIIFHPYNFFAPLYRENRLFKSLALWVYDGWWWDDVQYTFWWSWSSWPLTSGQFYEKLWTWISQKLLGAQTCASNMTCNMSTCTFFILWPKLSGYLNNNLWPYKVKFIKSHIRAKQSQLEPQDVLWRYSKSHMRISNLLSHFV